MSLSVLTVVVCGVISSGFLADAAAVRHKSNINMAKRSIDMTDGGFGMAMDLDAGAHIPGGGKNSLDHHDKETDTTPIPGEDSHMDHEEPVDFDPPPPDTVSPPRKITFDYRTEFNFDLTKKLDEKQKIELLWWGTDRNGISC